MSTKSGVARVFVDEEEDTFSLFSSEEQAKLNNGKYNQGILDKIHAMSFQQFEWEKMFLFFSGFVGWIIKGHNNLSVARMFCLVKAFAVRETMAAEPIEVKTKEDEIPTDKDQEEDFEFLEAVACDDFIEVTVSGHLFEGDNLIAL